jgi:hypothetical protein
MAGISGASAWGSGFVISGLVGVTLLLASGTYLGVKAKGLEQLLQNLTDRSPDAAPPRLAPPRLVAMLPMINTGIALSVVFDMVTKPASVPVAIGVILMGILVSVATARLKRPTPMPSHARVSAHVAPDEIVSAT